MYCNLPLEFSLTFLSFHSYFCLEKELDNGGAKVLNAEVAYMDKMETKLKILVRFDDLMCRVARFAFLIDEA